MRKDVHDRGDVLAVRARPDDAAARLRRVRKSIHSRIAANQTPLLTNAERDLLLVAVAQSLRIL